MHGVHSSSITHQCRGPAILPPDPGALDRSAASDPRPRKSKTLGEDPTAWFSNSLMLAVKQDAVHSRDVLDASERNNNNAGSNIVPRSRPSGKGLLKVAVMNSASRQQKENAQGKPYAEVTFKSSE